MATPKVDLEAGIGCGLCREPCPNILELRDDKAGVTNPDGCKACDCRQAADSRPVTAV